MKTLHSLLLMIAMLALQVGAEEIELGSRIDGVNKRLRAALLDMEEVRALNAPAIKELADLLSRMQKDDREDKGTINELKKYVEDLELEVRNERGKVEAIEKEKSELLNKNGLKDGICALHGEKMEKTTVSRRFGFRLSAYSPIDYSAVRLPLFPNSDEPIEGGCSPGFGNSIEWMTCPSCNAARKKWLLENSRPLPK